MGARLWLGGFAKAGGGAGKDSQPHRHGGAKRGGCGAILDAGSVLFALTSDKELVVFKPSDKAFTEVAKYKVADTPIWAAPIVSGNRVFVKDKDSLTLWTIN